MQDGPIPDDVRQALHGYLRRQGLPHPSADGLLAALAEDLAAGVAGTTDIYDRLVAAATLAAGERVEALAVRIAELAAIPMAPEEA